MISVIIPTYNNESAITRCLTSIINQTYLDIEIIIINDGSTDKTGKKVLSIKDKRIRYVSQSNQGPSAARNKGLELAKGEYILFVDADDYVEPDMLKLLYTTAQKNNAQIVNCNICKKYSEKKNRMVVEPYKENQSWQEFYKDFLLHNGLCSLCNKLIKKSLFENIRLYEDIRLGEDSTAFLRILPFATNIAHIRKPLYVYDLTNKSIFIQDRKNIYEYMTGTNRVIEYYKKQNIPLPLPEYFLRLKVCYYTLFFMPLGKAKKLGYDDYFKLARDFLDDYKKIISDPHFKQLALKYRLFTILYNTVYYWFCRVRGINV